MRAKARADRVGEGVEIFRVVGVVLHVGDFEAEPLEARLGERTLEFVA